MGKVGKRQKSMRAPSVTQMRGAYAPPVTPAHPRPARCRLLRNDVTSHHTAHAVDNDRRKSPEQLPPEKPRSVKHPVLDKATAGAPGQN